MELAAVPGVPLLERSEELARIESALARARTGRGSFVVIEGPAGIGKTAVLLAARTAAAGQDMRVLRSRGAELERDFAFGVVRQLFEPVLAEAAPAERADWLQGAAGVAAGLLDSRAASAARRPREASIPRSRSCMGSTGCAPIKRPSARSASSSTTRIGPTGRRCATWPSC
jgi:hypothetical protein